MKAASHHICKHIIGFSMSDQSLARLVQSPDDSNHCCVVTGQLLLVNTPLLAPLHVWHQSNRAQLQLTHGSRMGNELRRKRSDGDSSGKQHENPFEDCGLRWIDIWLLFCTGFANSIIFRTAREMATMEDLPTYDESFERPLILQPTHSQSDSNSTISSDAPPAFSVSPITLILEPGSTIVRPIYEEEVETRALYELTLPPNGVNRSLFLAEVPSITRLNKSGHLPQIEKRHHLYKISETQEGSQKYTAIDGRKTRSMHGTMLRSSEDGTSLVATDRGNAWGNQGRLIYCARKNGEVMEWTDCRGRVVAIDQVAPESGVSETLQILVPLNRKWLDMLVAVWVSRIQQDAQRQICLDRRRDNLERRRSTAQEFLRGSRSFFKVLND
jgi:hypothetical protein